MQSGPTSCVHINTRGFDLAQAEGTRTGRHTQAGLCNALHFYRSPCTLPSPCQPCSCYHCNYKCHYHHRYHCNYHCNYHCHDRLRHCRHHWGCLKSSALSKGLQLTSWADLITVKFGWCRKIDRMHGYEKAHYDAKHCTSSSCARRVGSRC